MMALTTFAWLVVLCPLVGAVAIALGFRRLGGRPAGWLGTAMIALVVRVRGGDARADDVP